MEDTVLQAESLRRFCEECLVVPHVPFGGIKQSGHGPYAIGATNQDFYTNLKVVYHQYRYEENNLPTAQQIHTEEDPA